MHATTLKNPKNLMQNLIKIKNRPKRTHTVYRKFWGKKQN